MKFGVVALTTLLTAIGLAVPVTAQIKRPSQEFFEQGRDQLEREIQNLQQAPSDSQGSLEKPRSEPVLEVSPSPESTPSQKPNEDETPTHKPNEVDNSHSRSSD